MTATSRATLELATVVPRRPPETARSVGVADQWKTAAPAAAQRGEFARALDLYRSLAAVEPNVPMHHVRAGDCLVKLGQKRDALVEYRVAAGAYHALGMQVHARSAWRLVLGIVPADADARARLAALDARVRGAKPGTPPPLPATAVVLPPPAELILLPESLPAPPALLDVSVEKAIEKALAITPVVVRRVDVRPPVKEPLPAVGSFAALALQFADLDDDEDQIWIDLEGIVEVAAKAPVPVLPVHKDTEPVAFFTSNDGDDSGLSRQSGPADGPRGSILDEETKPVPPPEP